MLYHMDMWHILTAFKYMVQSSTVITLSITISPTALLWQQQNVNQSSNSKQRRVALCCSSIWHSSHHITEPFTHRLTSNRLNTWSPRQNSRHFTGGIFKSTVFNEDFSIFGQFSLEYICQTSIYINANSYPCKRLTGEKTSRYLYHCCFSLLVHICVTQQLNYLFVWSVLIYCEN